jgi:hypothetical protein
MRQVNGKVDTVHAGTAAVTSFGELGHLGTLRKVLENPTRRRWIALCQCTADLEVVGAGKNRAEAASHLAHHYETEHGIEVRLY